jgi:multidrug efflux system outer membrane protein
MTRLRSARPAAWAAALALTGLLAGCAAGPDYVRPELQTDVPASWVHPAADETAALPAGLAADGQRWWEAFGDTTLNGLVDAALQHNQNLAQAVARVLEARAAVTAAGSAQWPTLEVGGSAARSKTSEAVTMFGPVYGNTFAATATARWEVDLWGRLSRGKEAAVAAALASEENRRAVAQSLIADVVRTWLQIRELRMQVELTERTVTSFQRSLQTVEDRYRRGLVGPLDVHLAGQNLAAAQAQLPAFRRQLGEARRALEILTGRYPAGTIAASDLETAGGAAPMTMPEPLAPVPAGLPSELLDRRPDLRAAEAELAASVARIGQAKAALYPRLSLTADGGSRSRELDDLFTQPASAWSLVGNLVMPLLNRGATTSQVKAAEARAQAAVAAYRGAVLRAFGEVENALDQEVYQAEQERHLTESASRARSAVTLAEERYRRGLDNLLTTLEAQRRLVNAESSLLTTQRLRRTARVNLILALGGPWDPDNGDSASADLSLANQGAQP